ncbi:hypothetical protein ACVWZ6_005268 [Bradyrhizobium sp. GM6.1]
MWETVRDMTLKSQAPTLVYEEGSLIKRSLRDLYNKEIDEIQVAGDAGYREARDFMKMLMPANVSAVRQYRDGQPLFSRMGVESQLDAMFSPTVQLRSGGYIVINQTEALVSIDVNSGRSTREHHIEDTALKTNLEASEEVARQLRLRDLAGLIVIDFIDMDEKRNNRAVERKLSDCLRQDRARIQVGRISHFGLLEMSRQRIRASVLESSTDPCTHCGGTGHVRSVSSVALQLLRGLEEILMKGATHNLVVRTRTDVALYVLNHKRGHLRDLENGFKVTLSVIADPSVSGPQAYVIDRGEQVHTLEAAKALQWRPRRPQARRPWSKRPMTTRSSIRRANPRSRPRRPKVSSRSRPQATPLPSRTASAASVAVAAAVAVVRGTRRRARMARPLLPRRPWRPAKAKRMPRPNRKARKARNRQPVASSRAAPIAVAGVVAVVAAAVAVLARKVSPAPSATSLVPMRRRKPPTQSPISTVLAARQRPRSRRPSTRQNLRSPSLSRGPKHGLKQRPSLSRLLRPRTRSTRTTRLHDAVRRFGKR